MSLTHSNDILIVEDEPFIALDLESMLENAGFTTKVCTSSTGAMEWLSSQRPLAAVLDIELREGPCTAIALLLGRRSIPFVVCSGSLKTDAPEIFANGIWLQKPSEDESVVMAIRGAVNEQKFEVFVEK